MHLLPMPPSGQTDGPESRGEPRLSRHKKEDDTPQLSSDFMMAASALSTNSPVSRFVTDGLGPSPKSPPPEKEKGKDKLDDFEWDGVVDEDAHLGLDDW